MTPPQNRSKKPGIIPFPLVVHGGGNSIFKLNISTSGMRYLVLLLNVNFRSRSNFARCWIKVCYCTCTRSYGEISSIRMRTSVREGNIKHGQTLNAHRYYCQYQIHSEFNYENIARLRLSDNLIKTVKDKLLMTATTILVTVWILTPK